MVLRNRSDLQIGAALLQRPRTREANHQLLVNLALYAFPSLCFSVSKEEVVRDHRLLLVVW